ncbi:RmlC-like cupin domain superfamily [Arabidopsis thaliana x Arabidopsis arenosa]|uniref:RmlC-like cupin domain superfamily n=1 Tax=Arabidopsis thaliana x Arabidopsis arenosa TaxID=1240361 RepID=A0A8T1ZNW3_9BRAS|nr:RmlC-like cupin domain superfamily [Arabidopsis thaliana x Arabidopsis arenosa]
MANPRRVVIDNQRLSPIINLLKKPQAFPILLSFFLFLTWISLRLQHSSHVSSSSSHPKSTLNSHPDLKVFDDDDKVNLIRFGLASLSPARKDERGWLLDPVILARDSQLKGGAASCVSIHVGEIRPGGLRGNHRHHTCNETFVIWGAKTRFRLENHEVDKGYAEVLIGEDEVAVAVSPSGTAHALVNVDPVRSTFFIGCQDYIQNNSSTSDYKVWNDL